MFFARLFVRQIAGIRFNNKKRAGKPFWFLSAFAD
jgi:hypothetical protein